MNPRKVVPVLVVLALALGVTGLVLLVRGGGDDGESQRTAATGTSTSTSSTRAATTTTGSFTTTPTSPPPAPPSTVTPGTVVVATTQPPDTEAEPPTAAGPSDTAGSDPTPTTSPPTTSPATTSRPPASDPGSADDDDPFETIVYSPDGAPERKGDLLVPEDHGSTAIVLVHGGDGTNGNRRQMRGWAEGYAEAGYPTLSISYFKYKEATDPPVFPVPERDVKAAVQYLRQHADDLEIDPDRILVQGFGAGAGLGSIAYVTGDDSAFAGEGLHDDDTSDVVNGFIGFYGDYEGERADAEQYCGGPPDSTDPEVEACYDLGDAVGRATDATGPALLVHGDEDETIPYETTEAFGDALTDADIEALVVMVEGADHDFDRNRRALTPEGEAMLVQIVAWLELTFPEAAAAGTTTPTVEP